MKKNRVALILVLFVVCSYPVFSDQENCIQTPEYYSGLDGGRLHPARVWGLLGFGLTTMGNMVQWITAMGSESWIPIGPGIGTAISIALPWVIEPEPKIIPADISEDQINCYREGYKITARRKTAKCVLVGCAAGWIFALGWTFMAGY